MTFEEKILAAIESYGPVKLGEIESRLIQKFGVEMHAECANRHFKDKDYLTKLLRTLAERREVIEIEYACGGVEEDAPWQEESRTLYFGKLTEITIRGQD